MTARATFPRSQVMQARALADDGFRVTLERDGTKMVIERAPPALPSPVESGSTVDRWFHENGHDQG